MIKFFLQTEICIQQLFCESLAKMTYSSEKFCLKWNDFQQNIVSSYHDLRKDADFCDVTLLCEEGQQIEAHRIILTACSPFFSTVLKRNKHSHPMIYMRGLKAKDLEAIVDFIYYGEANIYQEDLDGFLALAEELQLKGLAGAQDDSSYDKTNTAKQLNPKRKPTLGHEEYQPKKPEESDILTRNHLIVPLDAGKLLVPVNTNKEELKAQLESMMVKAEDGDIKNICTVCGKTATGKDWGSANFNMRRHVETHMEGLSYTCKQCGKVSR